MDVFNQGTQLDIEYGLTVQIINFSLLDQHAELDYYSASYEQYVCFNKIHQSILQ
jgi:hypothetical protein